MNHTPQAAFFGAEDLLARVYAQGRYEKIAARAKLFPHNITSSNFEEYASQLQSLEVIFSTWGMPRLSSAQLRYLPNLRAVFYAAGSVRNFAYPFLERDILVVSAWAANAVPVAEYVVAQILLSTKGYFRNVNACKTPEGRAGAPFQGSGNFGETVAILGAGQIGRKVIELLRPFNLKVIVFDPFLSNSDAVLLGAEKVSLEEAFARGYVVTNHIANLPATVGLLNKPLFTSLRPDATFINTGRGATVIESDLCEVLAARPDLTALLDVTNPEPPHPNSPFYNLPNVHLTSHIAGSIGDEVVRMADYMIEEFDNWIAGEPLQYAVTLPMLETMA
jgi:phosphoglycerate dehydrogenase-like enzyme